MGQQAEQLYDDATMQLMSEAYEAAEKQVGTSDKALQVTMAVAIIRAINEGERDKGRLSALAVSAVRADNDTKPRRERASRPGWVDLAAPIGSGTPSP
jgi:hypothetical protein